ncbi:MAG: DNA ligase, partial [Pyrobaculum sp.]
MEFVELARALASIESTTQRTVMVKLLVGLFKKLGPDEIDKAIYIILGDIRPPWEGIELGVGEKLCLRALARASGAKVEELEELYKRTGDMGEVARRALSKRQAQTLLAFAGAKKGG